MEEVSMAAAEQAFINKLAALFPTSFTRDRCDPHRPLKIGIHRDILAHGILTEDEANAALAMYTRRPMYQRALAAGGVRVDLDGNPAGEVTAEQVQAAERSVAGMEKNRARKAKAAAEQRAAAKAEANDATAPAPAPKRLGLSELRAAALARRAAESRA
jgi:ProP effector